MVKAGSPASYRIRLLIFVAEKNTVTLM